ncbi:3-oxoacyl-[acyl-carrier-protein] synthase-3 [Paucibacter oligotrophus]|uniref:3-oxoacyl-[acyl-carrier-protein] synthase-3 n=1 Tax=Roseateles oligotrophus TaxID=1769250 RepID=A0A840L9C8_9BURK|nr:3-oxoacyl-[acyl-carrier-protein] synthase III C-terminal domain-containing protein [Roseateles oligotrophus]MBB4843365.1 3-oxoacyl-[acyl-carrier-protein] synthase-3 [Roseateles oligotrophus]
MRPGRVRLARGRRRLLGWGSAYPGPAIATEDLCRIVAQRFGQRQDRLARVLAGRLGVQSRHLCRDFAQALEAPRPGDRNPELAARALQAAQRRAGLGADALGYLISHSCTPALLLPGGSAEIARLVGHQGAHLELRQACTGFANALQLAFALTAEPGSAPVGIVGVETGSVFFDPYSLQDQPEQWVNFLQMGDGAAAVIIGPDEAEGGAGPWLQAVFFGQCQQAPAPGLRLRMGGSDCPMLRSGALQFEHDYAAVALHGLYLLEQGRAALAQAGWALERAAWLVPHQAGGAVGPWLARQWALPPERVCGHGAQVGNLGSASIWAALDHLMSDPAPPGPLLFLGAEATQYSYGGFALERA